MRSTDFPERSIMRSLISGICPERAAAGRKDLA